MATLQNLFLFFSLFSLQLQFSVVESDVKAGYWFPASEFPVSDIDSALFTHLFCAFASLDPDTNQVTIDSANADAFSTFTETVQQNNSDVETLLSIGGGSSNPDDFSSMASQPSSRATFIDSAIQLARDNGFYGLDLDWEYPQNASDMTNLGTLLEEWRVAVAAESNSTGNTALLLTAAVYFSSVHESVSYPVESLETNLDWVNVMAYDFKAPGWSPDSTGAPAALYVPSSQFSGSAGIENWIGSGMPSQNLVLGLPLYGYAWELVDPTVHGIGAPANGSASGEGIGSDGSITYNQINAFIERTGATEVYNSTWVTNYCYSGSTWIGYDDVDSIEAKVTYAKENDLLGYFVWSVSGDDNWTLCQTASLTWDGSSKMAM